MNQAPSSAHPTSARSREIRYFHKKLQKLFRRWDLALMHQENMQQLALEYPQHLIFLIYGKVNSGKTTLCNWLIQELSEHVQRCFQVKDGSIETCVAPFKASAINDEASIQGVEIGKRLLVVDAPGLYSTNRPQAALAHAMIAYSDAVLWVTPAHAPGQHDELKDLAKLLQQGKPMLPIISCSDIYEENIDLLSQTLDGHYRNKEPAVRQLQQQELLTRIRRHVACDIEPISISVKMCEQTQDIKSSGLDTLLQQLAVLVQQASFYKLKKQQYHIEDFMQQRILGDLQRLLEKGQSQMQQHWQHQ